MELNNLIHFILGGTLFTIIHYYASQKDTLICSIIPAFPVLCLTSLIYLIYYKGNVIRYIKNSIYTFSTVVLFLVSLYIMTKYTNDINTSLFLSLIIYLITLYCLINKKILI